MAQSNWEQWEGKPVVGNDGQKIGKVSQVYLDQDSQEPTWATVQTGLFGGKEHFVPLQAGSWQGENYQVPFAAQQVKDAPQFDADQELTHDEENKLFAHYGMYNQPGSTPEGGQGGQREPQGAVGHDTSGPNTDNAMTRSEERLNVGVVRRPSESVRLRKTIVSEPVSQTVPVRQEEINVQREPITESNRGQALAGGELTEEEHEVTLMREEPVMEKTVEPVERVRLDKTVTEQQQELTGEVRKEQIQVERG
ncbi:MAG: PRC and DUF2382 domain-containing protein [Candidatus Dormibacteria bacterium]